MYLAPINLLPFITYSDRVVQPHWKKIHMELKATDGELSTQFFRVLTSSNYKIPF